MEASEDPFVVVFSSDDPLGMTEVLTIKTMLESNGIPTFTQRVEAHRLYRTPLGTLGPRCVEVPESRREEAERLIAEALEAGPAAAEEAEALYESEHPFSGEKEEEHSA